MESKRGILFLSLILVVFVSGCVQLLEPYDFEEGPRFSPIQDHHLFFPNVMVTPNPTDRIQTLNFEVTIDFRNSGVNYNKLSLYIPDHSLYFPIITRDITYVATGIQTFTVPIRYMQGTGWSPGIHDYYFEIEDDTGIKTRTANYRYSYNSYVVPPDVAINNSLPNDSPQYDEWQSIELSSTIVFHTDDIPDPSLVKVVYDFNVYPTIKEGDKYYYNPDNPEVGAHSFFFIAPIPETNKHISGPIRDFTVKSSIPPTISGTSVVPNPALLGENIEFTANVNDNGASVENVRLIVAGKGPIADMAGNPRKAVVNSNNLGPGDHKYRVEVLYNGGSSVQSDFKNFTVFDSNEPISIFNVDITPNPVLIDKNLTFRGIVRTNQNNNLNYVRAVGSNGIIYDMKFVQGTYDTFEVNISASDFGGGAQHTLNITTEDNQGNIANSGAYEFVVNSNFPPTISKVNAIPNPVVINEEIIISAEIFSNPISVSQAYVKLEENVRAFNMNSKPRSVYETRLVDTSILGLNRYKIYAVDNNGNVAITPKFYEFSVVQPGQANCGNGVINTGEDCDGTNKNNQTCSTLGYDSGNLNCNPIGNANACKFDTSNCVDNTKPNITNIEVAPGDDLAVITWDTNEDSSSKVYYGESSGNLNNTKFDSSFVQDHSLRLTNLEIDTKYYYKVESSDRSGNGRNSSVDNFTTLLVGDSTPPVLENYNVYNIESDSVVINIESDEPTFADVDYGTSSDSYSRTKKSSSYFTNYVITLTNLESNTKYYYRITLHDASGNQYESSEKSFTTLSSSGSSDGSGDECSTDSDCRSDEICSAGSCYVIENDDKGFNFVYLFIALGVLIVGFVIFYFVKNSPRRPKVASVTQSSPIVSRNENRVASTNNSPQLVRRSNPQQFFRGQVYTPNINRRQQVYQSNIQERKPVTASRPLNKEYENDRNRVLDKLKKIAKGER